MLSPRSVALGSCKRHGLASTRFSIRARAQRSGARHRNRSQLTCAVDSVTPSISSAARSHWSGARHEEAGTTAGTEHIKDDQNTFEFATKALGDCSYSMQSGYPTQFHRKNRGCVVRAMLNRNANTAVGMNATVTPVRVIRMRPRYVAAKSSRARRRR